MGANNDNLEAIRALNPLAAPGVKVFMDASTGNMLVDNPETLWRCSNPARSGIRTVRASRSPPRPACISCISTPATTIGSAS